MRILSIETPASFEAAVYEATNLLEGGDVVALPTETVYGLAANALEPSAVRKIFRVKGRPPTNPLIVHVASFEMAKRCVSEWPERAKELARKHWPGPLTMVLPKSKIIPDEVTAGGETVAIRWPSHPFMQAVIRSCGFPLAAPSANKSNEVSPTTAAHVASSLGNTIPLIINAGSCNVGIESTVFDVLGNRVLRPGMISAVELGARDGNQSPDGGPLRSPGMLEKHYSPRARLIVARWKDTNEALRIIDKAAASPEKTQVIAYDKLPSEDSFAGVSMIPEDPEAYARALYAELHRCDEAGAELILVEEPPAGEKWDGIHDRLRRAAR